jgi:hypothetical protein
MRTDHDAAENSPLTRPLIIEHASIVGIVDSVVNAKTNALDFLLSRLSGVTSQSNDQMNGDT